MSHKRWRILPLLLILLVALGLRLHGLAFGLPALNDPDELMFELGAFRMLRGLTLNPGWFGHPATTTMYGLAFVNVLSFASGYAMGLFDSVRGFGEFIYADPSWVVLPGRLLMVGFAIGVVALTFQLGRSLFDRTTGLLAASIIAVNPVEISWSQVIRSDIMASFFMLACLMAALRNMQQGHWRDDVRTAFWLGLAIATKWPFAISGLGVFTAIVINRRSGQSESAKSGFRSLIGRMIAVGIMALGFLLLISPYLLLDYGTVLRNLQGEVQLHHLGATGGGPWQNAIWYLTRPISTGLGIVGIACTVLGVPAFVRNRAALALLGPVLVGFFVIICLQQLVWERWALPLFPLLAIIAGAGVNTVLQWSRNRLSAWPSGLRVSAMLNAAVVAIVLAPLLLAAHANARARLHDTRQAASRWAIAHIPAGSAVLIEHFAFDLYAQPWQFLFPLGDVGCVDAKAMLRGKVGYGAIDSSRGTRSNVDYGTMSSAKHDTCSLDYAILTQYDRYRAEKGDFPTEFAAYEALIARGTIVATFFPEAGQRAGPIVQIVQFER